MSKVSEVLDPRDEAFDIRDVTIAAWKEFVEILLRDPALVGSIAALGKPAPGKKEDT